MKIRLTLVLAAGLFGVGTEEEPGWLAEALSSQDPDVEAALASYASEDYPQAIASLDAAVARRGERSELYYDRGLVLLAQANSEGARAAFQHGTESRSLQVRASSHYELGNLAMHEEDWEGAIAAYIACLTASPTHQNAKWNLELALLRKQEQEKEEQEKEDQEKDEQEDGEQDENQDGEQEQDENQDGEQEQDGEQGDQEQEQEQQEQEQEQEQDGEDGEQEQQEQQEQEQPPPQEQEQQQAEPQPIEAGELDSALDELDRQDAFMFGRPRGQQRKVEKDW